MDSLIKMGLMASVEKNKKKRFSPLPPSQLLSFLDNKEKEIAKKREDLKLSLSEFDYIYNLSSSSEKPRVMFFEGREGIKAIQNDILKSKIDHICEFVSLDDSYRVFPPKKNDHRAKMKKKLKKVVSRVIYTTQKGPFLKEKDNLTERRFVPYEKYPFHTEISVYANKTAFVSHQDKLIGAVIECQDISNSLEIIFNLAWEATEKHQREK